MGKNMPFVLGLTGSIAMGKTTTAQMFRDERIPVWDADAVVHHAYENNRELIRKIAALHPAALDEHKINRDKLRLEIQQNPSLLQPLEAIVHPVVAQNRSVFLSRARVANMPLVVCDIPLLFETNSAQYMDAVAVVYASEEAQRERLLARTGVTPEMVALLRARQMPDPEKLRRADYIIPTLDFDAARNSVKSLIERLRDA